MLPRFHNQLSGNTHTHTPLLSERTGHCHTLSGIYLGAHTPGHIYHRFPGPPPFHFTTVLSTSRDQTAQDTQARVQRTIAQFYQDREFCSGTNHQDQGSPKLPWWSLAKSHLKRDQAVDTGELFIAYKHQKYGHASYNISLKA